MSGERECNIIENGHEICFNAIATKKRFEMK
jgi:hypothetical protein